MRSVLGCALIGMLVVACAMPKAGAAPVAPVERAWSVPTLELYQEWWTKTEKCSGLKGDMSQVTFYAVDSPSGSISLGQRGGPRVVDPSGQPGLPPGQRTGRGVAGPP